MRYEEVNLAVDKFFTDRSRRIRETLAGLEEIRDHVEGRAQMLRDDIEAGNDE